MFAISDVEGKKPCQVNFPSRGVHGQSMRPASNALT